MASGTRSRNQMQEQYSDPRRGSVEHPSKQDISLLILEELREFKKLFKKEIREELKDTREEIRSDTHKEIESLASKIDRMTGEFKDLKTEVEQLTTQTKDLEKKTSNIMTDQQNVNMSFLLQEVRYRERNIKLRGLPEAEKEQIFDRIIPALAEYIETSEETLNWQIEKIFRINSRLAKEKNLDRDIAICFTNARLRNKVCSQNLEKKLIIEDKEIEIYKDIPIQILRRRQDYRFLTQELLKNNIKYRWDTFEGIVFSYRQKRYKIDNLDKAKDFYRRIVERDKKPEEERTKGKKAKDVDKETTIQGE